LQTQWDIIDSYDTSIIFTIKIFIAWYKENQPHLQFINRDKPYSYYIAMWKNIQIDSKNLIHLYFNFQRFKWMSLESGEVW
jgi:hypothetical protein